MPAPHADAGLPDDCIYFAPDASLPVWLSPRIKVLGPAATGDIQPGVSNSIQVFVNRSPAPCSIPDPVSKVFIKLYICVPTTGLAPDNATLAHLIDGPTSGTIDLSVLPAGGQKDTTILWTPDTTAPAGSAQAPGHRCLIAVCFPHTVDPTNIPDPSNFYVGADSHYAQHNLCVLPCNAPQKAVGAPGGERQPQRLEAEKECSLTVAVTNMHKREPQHVRVQVVPELHPNAALTALVTARARGVAGFRRLAAEPTPVQVTFPEFPNIQVRDVTRQGCAGSVMRILGLAPAAPPHKEADLPMRAGQTTSLLFRPDLSRATPGDAYIHHVTQTGADGRLQGGITIVTVAE